MKNIDEIKNIVTSWARNLPFPVKIHLFGSVLKGKIDPSDVDISLEFLDDNSKKTRRDRHCEYLENWTYDLAQLLGMPVDLQFYEKNMKRMPKALSDASLLLYDSTEQENPYST